MCFSVAEVQSFLVSRWSLPIRSACPHLSQQMRQSVTSATNLPVPRWARPQYLLRYMAEAIAERMAWQATQPEPETPRYRFGLRSAPCWSQPITIPYNTRTLRRLTEEIDTLWYFGIEIERLYRIMRTPPSEVGETLWMLTLLASCQHLAQFYGELKRRCKARRARELLQQALDLFVTWRASEAA